MSYILDALRRAEAERGRGAVPGLHTQAVVPGAVPVAGRPAISPALVAAAVVAVAGVAAAGTWWAMQRPAPAAAVVVAAAPAPAAPAAPAVPAVPVAPAAPIAPAAPAAVAPVPPVPAQAAPQRPEPRPVEKREAPSPREKPAAAPLAPRAIPAEPPPRARAAEPTRAPAVLAPVPVLKEPAAATTATGTVFAQSDLPEAVRAQLPALKISGVTYSGNPVYRMAIVNGQVLHEGDAAGPGLLLERIEPGRTVWSFKGYRYGLASQ